MDDVVVIGGGIIGTATAYFLSKEGIKVKVIEGILLIKQLHSHYPSVDSEDNFSKKKIFC